MKLAKIPACILSGLIACECGECKAPAFCLTEIILTVGAVGAIGTISVGIWKAAKVCNPSAFEWDTSLYPTQCGTPFQGSIYIHRGSGCASFLHAVPNGLPPGISVNTNCNPAVIYGVTPSKPGPFKIGLTLAYGCGNSTNIILIGLACTNCENAPQAQPVAGNTGLNLPVIHLPQNSGTITTNDAGWLVNTQVITVRGGQLGNMLPQMTITATVCEDGTGTVEARDASGSILASENYSADSPATLQTGFEFTGNFFNAVGQ